MDIPSKYLHQPISFFRQDKLDYFCIGFISLIIYFISISSFGQGITNDSIDYISAGLTIQEGMLKTNGEIFCEWPPLFPLLLGISTLIGSDIITFAAILHGLIYCINVLLALYILKQSLTQKTIFIAGLIIILFSAPLLQVHVIIWSEPVFITLILLNIIFLEKYLQGRSLTNLGMLILLGMLMDLQRRTGVFFICATFILITKFTKRSIIHYVIYLCINSIPVIWFYLKRKSLSGIYMRPAILNMKSGFEKFVEFLNTFTSFLLPSQLPLLFRIITLVLLAVVLIYLLRKQNIKSAYLKISFFHFAAYSILLLISLYFIKAEDIIDDRILSPVYLPFFISLLIIADHIFKNNRETIQLRIFNFIITLILFFWTIYPLSRTIYHINRWNTSGTGGYNSTYWRSHNTIQSLEKEKVSNIIFTNHVHALRYYLNYKNDIPYIIYPQHKLMTSKSSYGLLVCIESVSDNPAEACISESINNKVTLKNFKDGTIWKLKK
ncbi:MAG: hypothetical protein K2X86_05150 [Cytophagaceae bacterium]|nr:hypothetical protein [Cytophagaceae bacterium]